MTKFLACRYHKASDLQKLAFLPNVWQFLIDIFIMKATFSGLELSGFVLLFVFYGGYLAHYVYVNQKQATIEPILTNPKDDNFSRNTNINNSEFASLSTQSDEHDLEKGTRTK